MPTLNFASYIASPMWTGIKDGTNGGTISVTNYVYGSSGTVVGYEFAASSTELEKVHFYLETGSASYNPGPLIEVRNWNTSTHNDPGTTVLSSQVIAYQGEQTWHTVTFSPTVPMTIGTYYWIVIAGESTDTFDVIRNVGNSDDTFSTFDILQTDSSGWSGSSATRGRTPLVLEFADGTLSGNPYVNQSTSLSTTTEYGIKIDPLNTPLQINAILLDNYTNLESIQVYRGDNDPGSPERTITPGAFSLTLGEFAFAPILLDSGTPYRITFKYSAFTTPTVAVANNATLDSILNCGIFGGKMYLTTDNSGSWEDHRDMFPLCLFAIKGFDNDD